jgi:hypothetical protein
MVFVDLMVCTSLSIPDGVLEINLTVTANGAVGLPPQQIPILLTTLCFEAKPDKPGFPSLADVCVRLGSFWTSGTNVTGALEYVVKAAGSGMQLNSSFVDTFALPWKQ